MEIIAGDDLTNKSINNENKAISYKIDEINKFLAKFSHYKSMSVIHDTNHLVENYHEVKTWNELKENKNHFSTILPNFQLAQNISLFFFL